jgi:hypothetical protein
MYSICPETRPGQASGINHLSGILRAAGACLYSVNISVFVLGITGVFGCLLLSVPVERGRVGEVCIMPPYPLVVTNIGIVTEEVCRSGRECR